jgi:hypothetical protein
VVSSPPPNSLSLSSTRRRCATVSLPVSFPPLTPFLPSDVALQSLSSSRVVRPLLLRLSHISALILLLRAGLTDFFLNEGIEQAKALDEHFSRTGKVVGPLHGVPISIKDHMPIEGRWESNGFFSSVKISEKDCDMVAYLRKLGAVFYVKTNQPQAIMHLECHSTMGRTVRRLFSFLVPSNSGSEFFFSSAQPLQPWSQRRRLFWRRRCA